MTEPVPASATLSYTQHLPKAYISRYSKFAIAASLVPISFFIIRFIAKPMDPIGPLIGLWMFGGAAGVVIARLRGYTLTVVIDDVGVNASIMDVMAGPRQSYQWDEIGSITVRSVNIKREFGSPGFRFSDWRTLKGVRYYGRKVSFICDGTEAIELRMRDGRIAIITVSDGKAVRDVLEALGHPAS